MKKWLSLLLCLILMLQSVSALAVTAEFEITKAALKAMDDQGWHYTVRGMTDDGTSEKVTIEFDADNKLDGVSLTLYFNKNTERVQISSFKLISYNEKDFAKVLRVCNELNDNYLYVKFYCDESENAVTAEFDAYIPVKSAGEIVVSMITRMVSIVDEAYPSLEVYAK